MKSKKWFALVTMFAILLFGFHSNLQGQEQKDPNKDPNNKIKLLEEKIKTLENVVELQRETISRLKLKFDEQTKENERLKKLCSQAGIDTTPQKLQKGKTENIIEISPYQIEQFPEIHKDLTYLQQTEFYAKNYAGKTVQWSGRFISVNPQGKGGYIAGFEHIEPKTDERPELITKVMIEFPESMKQRLLLLKKGSLITYQVILPDRLEQTRVRSGSNKSSLHFMAGKFIP